MNATTWPMPGSSGSWWPERRSDVVGAGSVLAARLVAAIGRHWAAITGANGPVLASNSTTPTTPPERRQCRDRVRNVVGVIGLEQGQHHFVAVSDVEAGLGRIVAEEHAQAVDGARRR